MDKPDGWEWRLTAELMCYFNGPLFRKISDLRDGLVVKPQQHITEEEVLDWVQKRLTEYSKIISPLSNLVNRLSESCGPPGEPGSANEIHHICCLIRDNLEQVVDFEEKIYFTNAPDEYEKVFDLLKDLLGSQAEKLADIPATLDEAVSIIDTDHGGDSEDFRMIKKTIVFDVPEGWNKKLVREFKRARKISSGEGGMGFWSTFLIAFLVIWLITLIF